MRRRVAAVLALVGLLATSLAGPSAATDPGVIFLASTVTVDFPNSTTWTQAFTARQRPSRVELVSHLAGSDALEVRDTPIIDVGLAGNGAEGYTVQLIDAGTELPNALVLYHFRVTTAAGDLVDGPDGQVRITDDRVTWQTLKGRFVTLHWYAGDRTFAQRALGIADDAVAATSKLLGVTETKPIDFFVYGDSQQFQTALPGTKEFVAGLAIAEIRTLFAIIQPSEIGSDWVQIVIPHELTHLVFDTATNNPYHVPPHWLNEGLAVYLSEGFTAADRGRLTDAIKGGTLLPLEAIADGFPQARQDLFYLGYAEGVSAIDFFERQFGEPKLVALIRSYAGGLTDDEAFKNATGRDMAGFEAAWLADIKADPPQPFGPSSPVPGPTPADWTATGPAAVQGSAAPGASAAPSGGPSPAPPVGGTSGDLLVGAFGGMALGVLILVVALVVMRRRRPAESATEPSHETPPSDETPSPPADETPPSPPVELQP